MEQRQKTLADGDHKLSVVDPLVERAAQFRAKAIGEDLAGGHVITEGKSARQGKEVIRIEACRVDDKVVEVNSVGGSTGTAESALRLVVAADSESRQDDCTYTH